MSTVETIQRKAPYIEDMEKGVLDSLFDSQYDEDGTFTGFGDQGLLSGEYADPTSDKYLFKVPDQKIAGIDPLQQKVFDTLGSQEYMDRFKPFFEAGSQYGQAGAESLKSGLGYLGAAQDIYDQTGDYFDQGAKFLQQGVGSFDPSSQVDAFMNPYQENVIDAAMKRLDEQDLQEQNKAQAGAIASGAFGGSRSRLNQGELQDRQAERRGDVLNKMLSQGYQSALGSSMKAFEEGKRRNLEGGRLAGGLGQGLGGIATGVGGLGGVASGIGSNFGGLGGMMGGLGRGYGGMTAADMNAMYSAGTSRQGYNQAILDADRANQMNPLKSAIMPLSIGQQYVKGTPSAGNIQQYTQGYQQSHNPFLQGVGTSLALGGYGQVQ